MGKVTCALCYEFIDRAGEGLTTGESCKHSFHADCAVVRLNANNTRAAGVKLQTKCPACSVTDDRVIALLESIHQKLGGFGAKLDKVADEVKGLRTDFNRLNAKQTATNTKVYTVSARTALGGDEFVDAFRVGKRRRVAGSRRSGLVGPRSVIISLKSKDVCKRVIDAEKGKPDLTSKQISNSLPEGKVYVNYRQPAQLHQLRDRVLKAFPNVDRKYVWIAYGAVFLKKTQDDRP
ncbi:hypothetical protein KQX54_000311, partial [Cotesia glomerata]